MQCNALRLLTNLTPDNRCQVALTSYRPREASVGGLLSCGVRPPCKIFMKIFHGLDLTIARQDQRKSCCLALALFRRRVRTDVAMFVMLSAPPDRVSSRFEPCKFGCLPPEPASQARCRKRRGGDSDHARVQCSKLWCLPMGCLWRNREIGVIEWEFQNASEIKLGVVAQASAGVSGRMLTFTSSKLAAE